MPRPIQEKLRSGAWWGEQAAHASVGAALAGGFGALSLIDGSPHSLIYLFGMFVGSSAGAAYEIGQNWGDAPESNDVVDSNFDAWAFTIGAFIASTIWLLTNA